MLEARFQRGACALVVGVLACSCATELETYGPELEQHVEAIQDGFRDTGDPAVGVVLSDGAFCTGTLISQSIVLTAAHCLNAGPVRAFYTGPGAAWSYVWPHSSMIKHEVDAQVMHPSYRPGGNPDEGTSGLDLGLLHLKTPICGTSPWPIKTIAPVEGSTCVAVGYGTHSEAGVVTHSEKRSCVESLDGVFTDVLKLSPLTGRTDSGDSGGPLVCDWGGIAGVASAHNTFAPDRLYAARVDQAATWIQTTMASMTRPFERIMCIDKIYCRYCGLFPIKANLN